MSHYPNNKVVTTPAKTIISLEGKAEITISKNLQNIITFLHNKIQKDEWSGPLFYEILEGSIDDPSNLKIMAHHIHLQDIGTGAYTEYNQNASDFFTVLEGYPDIEQGLMENRIKIGHLHTHHSMDTFFSGTDTDELHSNAENYNMYLSLIVNFSCVPTAKIAVKGKRVIKNVVSEDKFSYTNHEGDEAALSFTNNSVDKEYECIAIINCDVNYEVDKAIEKQYNLIKEKKAAVHYPIKHYPTQYATTPGYRGNQNTTPSIGFHTSTTRPYLNESSCEIILSKLLFQSKSYHGDLWDVLRKTEKEWERLKSGQRKNFLTLIKKSFKEFVDEHFNFVSKLTNEEYIFVLNSFIKFLQKKENLFRSFVGNFIKVFETLLAEYTNKINSNVQEKLDFNSVEDEVQDINDSVLEDLGYNFHAQ